MATSASTEGATVTSTCSDEPSPACEYNTTEPATRHPTPTSVRPPSPNAFTSSAIRPTDTTISATPTGLIGRTENATIARLRPIMLVIPGTAVPGWAISTNTANSTTTNSRYAVVGSNNHWGRTAAGCISIA